jgi:hypothetical protein
MPTDAMYATDSAVLDMRPAPGYTSGNSKIPLSIHQVAPSQTLTVPVGPDVTAEVRLVGGTGELRKEHLEALIEYLQLAAKFAKPTAPIGGSDTASPPLTDLERRIQLPK